MNPRKSSYQSLRRIVRSYNVRPDSARTLSAAKRLALSLSKMISRDRRGLKRQKRCCLYRATHLKRLLLCSRRLPSFRASGFPVGRLFWVQLDDVGGVGHPQRLESTSFRGLGAQTPLLHIPQVPAIGQLKMPPGGTARRGSPRPSRTLSF